jgi:uncharacterized caspase-like protein
MLAFVLFAPWARVMTLYHFIRFIFCGIIILAAETTILPARADTRIALVVGNSEYRYIPQLNNPQNDATLIAETLTALGFKLVGNGPQLNLNKSQFDQAVQDFGNEIQSADVALFYYAGHGVQVRGANYLVPVGANPTREVDVDFQMLDINLVLREMEYGRARLNVLILDACRNNPFGARGLRATSAGLAQMQAPEGTLISFATQPGNVAQDGSGRNSPFSTALAQTIRTPGLDIFRAFNEVGLIVARATAGEQQPWVSLSPIKGDFYFAGMPKPEPDPLVEQARRYEAAAHVDTKEAWDSFLNLYKSGYYADLARAQRAKITSAQEAKAEAEAEARAKAEAEVRAHAQAIERQKQEAEAKAARDAALKAASEATATEKAKREAEARAAQAALEKAERETAVARQAQEAAKAAQLMAEQSVRELQQALETAREEAAAQAKKQIEIAALTSGAALPSVLNPTDVVRLMKFQLRQAGCDPGNETGVWDESSRKAVEKFNKYAGTKLDVNTPNLDALSVMRAKSGRICPLVCGAGTRIEGDHCVVAKSKSQEKRSVTPSSSARTASTGGSAAAELLNRCRSNDRAACETLCSAGFNGPCRRMNRPR